MCPQYVREGFTQIEQLASQGESGETTTLCGIDNALHPSNHPSTYSPTVRSPVPLSIHPSVRPSVHPFVCSSIHPSIHLSIRLPKISFVHVVLVFVLLMMDLSPKHSVWPDS